MRCIYKIVLCVCLDLSKSSLCANIIIHIQRKTKKGEGEMRERAEVMKSV